MQTLHATQEAIRAGFAHDLILLFDVYLSNSGVQYWSTQPITIDATVYSPIIYQPGRMEQLCSATAIDERWISDVLKFSVLNAAGDANRIELLTDGDRFEGAQVNVFFLFAHNPPYVAAEKIPFGTYKIESAKFTSEIASFECLDKLSFEVQKPVGRIISDQIFGESPAESKGKILPFVFGRVKNHKLIPVQTGKKGIIALPVYAGDPYIYLVEISTQQTDESCFPTPTDANPLYIYIGSDTVRIKEVDRVNKRLILHEPATLLHSHNVGESVIEKIAWYAFAIADHKIKSISNIRNGFLPLADTITYTTFELPVAGRNVSVLVLNNVPLFTNYSPQIQKIELSPDYGFISRFQSGISKHPLSGGGTYGCWTVALLSNAATFNDAGEPLFTDAGAILENDSDMALLNRTQNFLSLYTGSVLQTGSWGFVKQARLAITYSCNKKQSQVIDPNTQQPIITNYAWNHRIPISIFRNGILLNPDSTYPAEGADTLKPPLAQPLTNNVMEMQQAFQNRMSNSYVGGNGNPTTDLFQTNVDEPGIPTDIPVSPYGSISGEYVIVSTGTNGNYNTSWHMGDFRTGELVLFRGNIEGVALGSRNGWFDNDESRFGVRFSGRAGALVAFPYNYTFTVNADILRDPNKHFSAGNLYLSWNGSNRNQDANYNGNGTRPINPWIMAYLEIDGVAVSETINLAYGSRFTHLNEVTIRSKLNAGKNLILHINPQVEFKIKRVADTWVYLYNGDIQINNVTLKVDIAETMNLAGRQYPITTEVGYGEIQNSAMSQRHTQRIDLSQYMVKAKDGSLGCAAFFSDLIKVDIFFGYPQDVNDPLEIYIDKVAVELDTLLVTTERKFDTLTCDVEGYADSSGNLLDNPVSALQAILLDSQLGNLTNSDLDIPSFFAAQQLTHDWKIARVIDTPISIGELVTSLLNNSKLRMFQQGKYFLKYTEGHTYNATPVFTVDEDLLLAPVEKLGLSEQVANEIQVLYNLNQLTGEFAGSVFAEDSTSKGQSIGTKKQQLVAEWLNDVWPNIPSQLVNWYLERLAEIRQISTLRLPLKCAHLQRADILQATEVDARLFESPAEIVNFGFSDDLTEVVLKVAFDSAEQVFWISNDKKAKITIAAGQNAFIIYIYGKVVAKISLVRSGNANEGWQNYWGKLICAGSVNFNSSNLSRSLSSVGPLEWDLANERILFNANIYTEAEPQYGSVFSIDKNGNLVALCKNTFQTNYAPESGLTTPAINSFASDMMTSVTTYSFALRNRVIAQIRCPKEIPFTGMFATLGDQFLFPGGIQTNAHYIENQ